MLKCGLAQGFEPGAGIGPELVEGGDALFEKRDECRPFCFIEYINGRELGEDDAKRFTVFVGLLILPAPFFVQRGVELGLKTKELGIEAASLGDVGMGQYNGDCGGSFVGIHFKGYVSDAGFVIDPIDFGTFCIWDGLHVLAECGPECLPGL